MKRSFLLIIILSFIALISYAEGDKSLDKAHAEQQLGCADCHLTDQPEKKPKTNECLQCHESYSALAERTERLKPNPHKSHQGELRCTLCHKVHSPDVLFCNECHDFTQFKFK